MNLNGEIKTLGRCPHNPSSLGFRESQFNPRERKIEQVRSTEIDFG